MKRFKPILCQPCNWKRLSTLHNVTIRFYPMACALDFSSVGSLTFFRGREYGKVNIGSLFFKAMVLVLGKVERSLVWSMKTTYSDDENLFGTTRPEQRERDHRTAVCFLTRLSVSNDLKYDAQRDLSDIGAQFIEVHALNKVCTVDPWPFDRDLLLRSLVEICKDIFSAKWWD